ncbi:MAG: hypothetical protein ACYSTZ_01475 [Planctomycetota bacterium]
MSGYLIPTLLDYGENDFAYRLANWLVEMQNDDGSYSDMQGQKRAFDTAAVMEGLESTTGWNQQSLKARKWLKKQVRDDGAVRMTPENDETHLYTMRVSGLLGSQEGAEYWKSNNWPDTREHYVAYALEGLWKMDEYSFVVNKLLGRDWRSDDLCANAQFAILHHQAGLDATPFIELVESNRGALSDSWTAKWILDMWKHVEA